MDSSHPPSSAGIPSEREEFDGALARTRNYAMGALASGGVVILCIVVPINSGGWWDLFTVLPVAGLAQVILGLVAYSTGRRGARRRSLLSSEVPLEETMVLRRWSRIGLATAVLGIFGGLAVAGLIVAAGVAIGGAWGRPLRVGRKSVSARLGREGHRWAQGPRPAVGDLDPITRRALGSLWLHDAKKEQASVPAFAQLTWELAAVGAPASLLERCQHAATQEIDHARRCFAVVETYLGHDQVVGPIEEIAGGLPGRGGRLRCITTVAVGTLEDGCLIEDLNADFAEQAHAGATDPAARSLTACIAREEREHADLAWDILAWCVAQDRRVARAVRRRLARLPRRIIAPYSSTTAQLVAQADAQALVRHGRVPFERWPALFAERRALTVARAEALLDGLADAHAPSAGSGAADLAQPVVPHRAEHPAGVLGGEGRDLVPRA